MGVGFGIFVSVSDGSTYGFSNTDLNVLFEEVFSNEHLGCKSSFSAPPSLILYATTEKNSNQLTDDNKIATVTFNGSGWNIDGVVTRFDDNGRKLSGKKYVGAKLPSAASGSKNFSVFFNITPASTVKVETGSGFQECFPMLYNGTEFVPCQIKRYNGTAFEECTHYDYEDN